MKRELLFYQEKAPSYPKFLTFDDLQCSEGWDFSRVFCNDFPEKLGGFISENEGYLYLEQRSF